MTPNPVRVLDPPDADGEEYFLPAEKLIVGNPRQRAWQQYSDLSGKFFAGAWQSEVGKWREFRPSQRFDFICAFEEPFQ